MVVNERQVPNHLKNTSFLHLGIHYYLSEIRLHIKPKLKLFLIHVLQLHSPEIQLTQLPYLLDIFLFVTHYQTYQNVKISLMYPVLEWKNSSTHKNKGIFLEEVASRISKLSICAQKWCLRADVIIQIGDLLLLKE